jgi:hypothetical protein
MEYITYMKKNNIFFGNMTFNSLHLQYNLKNVAKLNKKNDSDTPLGITTNEYFSLHILIGIFTTLYTLYKI